MKDRFCGGNVISLDLCFANLVASQTQNMPQFNLPLLPSCRLYSVSIVQQFASIFQSFAKLRINSNNNMESLSAGPFENPTVFRPLATGLVAHGGAFPSPPLRSRSSHWLAYEVIFMRIS